MDVSVFIGLVIAGVTEGVKALLPGKVYGILTVLTALAVGVGVALLDTSIGLVDITVAEGIVLAFGAIGTVSVAKKIG